MFLVGMICPVMQEHFFDLFWNVKFFIAAKLKGFRLFKVPPESQWKAIFSVSLVCRSKFRRMDCSLNWSFINSGELCWDSFMIAPACESFQTWIQLKYQAFTEAGRQDPELQKHLFHTCHVHKAGLLFLPQISQIRSLNRRYRGFPYSSEWQKRPTIEKCWYNLSNLTNQGVYQVLVYRNTPLKEMITGSAVLAWVQAPHKLRTGGKRRKKSAWAKKINRRAKQTER